VRARVSQSILKRIDKLDAPLREKRNIGEYALAMYHGKPMPPGTATRAQRTVLNWPPILGWNEWEAIASVSQDALIAASAEDRDGKVQEPEPELPDPSNVSSRYKPVPGKLAKALSQPQVLR
jgi:hypothetical protein